MQHLNTRQKPYRELLKVGLPIILGQVGVILVSFVDNMMVGHYDTNHFASASFVNNIFALVYVLGIGFAYGLTPLVTTAWTKHKPYKAGGLLRLSLYLNLALALASTLVMGVLYFYLDRFDLAPELLPIVRPYYILQMISFVFFMLFGAFKQFFDGTGHTSVGMWAILGSNVLNIGLNWLLIYGHWGFPEWGLLGAGIATLASRIFVLAIFASFFASARFAVSRRGFCAGIWCRRNVSRLLRLGIPIGLYAGVETASFTIALLFVTRLGTLPLAVHQILCVVTTIGFFMYYGLGAATTILVSRYRTEGDLAGARIASQVGLELCIATALVAMALMLATRSFVGRIFSEDETIVAMTSIALIPVILYQLGDAMQVLYANALRGMEDVTHMAIYACLVHLFLEPGLAYSLGFHIGLTDPTKQLTAIWFAFPVGLLTLGILFRRRFVRITRERRATRPK